MGSADFAPLLFRARLRYEGVRVRRAAIGALPLLPIIALATALTERPYTALAFGIAALGLGVLALWYGREPQRAVLPGVCAGVVPLLLALCANQFHHCGPNGCVSFCVPACTLGGALAGFGLAFSAKARLRSFAFWLPASLLSLFTGAMGCSCVGSAGLFGLAVGFGVALLPALRRSGPRAS